MNKQQQNSKILPKIAGRVKNLELDRSEIVLES